MSEAVGISVVDAPPPGIARVPAPAAHCTMVGFARRGRSLWAASEDINCPIARYVLGCDPAGTAIDAAASAFLESKLAATPDAARCLVEGFRALQLRRRVFVYFPAPEAPMVPDIVVQVLRPEDAMRCLRALVTATGERTEALTAGAAAMCSDCTAAVLLTGRAALSPGCPGSRREIPIAPDEVLVSLPARLERALHAA